MAERTARRLCPLCEPQPAVFQISAVGDDLRCTRQSCPSCAVGRLILTVACIGRHASSPPLHSAQAVSERPIHSAWSRSIAQRDRGELLHNNHIEGAKEYPDTAACTRVIRTTHAGRGSSSFWTQRGPISRVSTAIYEWCCGVVRSCCCEGSAPKAAVFKLSAAPLPPPNPAIACTS